MKEYFYYAIALTVPLALLAWFLYAVGRALYTLFDDWRLGRELDEIQAQSASRREQKRRENEQRLDTGCEHDFDAGVFGMPPDVCGKCGLEREKPAGACDHQWRLVPGPIPSSRCEKCGKSFSVTGEHDRRT